MKKYLRIAEKAFIVLGLSFLSGVFGVDSLGLVLSSAVVTFIRFFVWGMSTLLVAVFWKNTIITCRNNILLCILSVIALLSFFWSEFPDFTLFNSRDVLMMTSFSLYFATRFNQKQQVQVIANTLLIGCFLSIIAAFVLPSVGIHQASDAMVSHPGAWKGVYGHKNNFGSMMVLSSVTFFTLPKENSFLYKWFGFGFSLVLMLLSTSKTSLVLSFVLIFIIMFYKNFRWHGKISVIFTNIGVLLLGCIIVPLLTYWVELLTGLGRDATFTGRTPIWTYALGRLMERPLLGYGRGAFWAPKSPYAIEAGQALGTGWVAPHGHNGFLDIALDLGLIGFLLFLTIYFTAFVRALKQGYATKNLEYLWPLAYLTFLSINNVTESILLRGENVYWTLFITVAFTLSQRKTVQPINIPNQKNYLHVT
ncbi:O-antigen ligase family protein [Brasilonema octagenarum]|uniref:O-antigen ligase family protein n=1 Tax=Brasilonema octagenarum UFV-OR1 TaxID=417115 RepID=A0ABX1M1Q3_9CYAN|nr:O-antigen ligase family protein [Brasilonema octagenarum UFV-OR1]